MWVRTLVIQTPAHFHFRFCFPWNSTMISKKRPVSGATSALVFEFPLRRLEVGGGNKLLTLFENKQVNSTYYWSCDRQDELLVSSHWPGIHTAVQTLSQNPYLWCISKRRTHRWAFHCKHTNQKQEHAWKAVIQREKGSPRTPFPELTGTSRDRPSRVPTWRSYNAQVVRWPAHELTWQAHLETQCSAKDSSHVLGYP